MLIVYTSKRYDGNLVTTAASNKIEGDFNVFQPYKDFHKFVITSALRCTAKNVAEQHAAALKLIGDSADDYVAKQQKA